jgi:hypothetical protein
LLLPSSFSIWPLIQWYVTLEVHNEQNTGAGVSQCKPHSSVQYHDSVQYYKNVARKMNFCVHGEAQVALHQACIQHGASAMMALYWLYCLPCRDTHCDLHPLLPEPIS